MLCPCSPREDLVGNGKGMAAVEVFLLKSTWAVLFFLAPLDIDVDLDTDILNNLESQAELKLTADAESITDLESATALDLTSGVEQTTALDLTGDTELTTDVYLENTQAFSK